MVLMNRPNNSTPVKRLINTIGIQYSNEAGKGWSLTSCSLIAAMRYNNLNNQNSG